MKQSAVTLFVAAAMMAGTPAQASAATHLGSTFTPADGCALDTTYIQTVSNGPAYGAPFSGVITSWSYRADAHVPTTLKLKIGRVSPGANLATDANVMIVAESAPQSPTANTLNTYPTRIPVQAGDDIGQYVNGTFTADCSIADTAYTDHYYNSDMAPGTTNTFFAEHFQEDIAALLEPDADHDGYGDETQDQCPTDPSTHGPCPTPATGQRAAALKKCKKKFRHNPAKRRKCRKRANSLPV